MAIDVIEKWTRKKFKSSSQSGMPGYNHDPHTGDILCKTEGHYFPFTVEVKNYAEIDFSQLLRPDLKGVTILEFWNQCSGDAKRCKKIPILMMRYNRMPADCFFLAVTQDFAKIIHSELTILQSPQILKFTDYKNGVYLSMFDSRQFFNADYKDIKQKAKNHLKIKFG